MKIKKLSFKLFLVIIIILINLTGCAPKSEPVSGAALDLQARFEDMFEDAEPAAAEGTVRFGEEPTEIIEPETSVDTTKKAAPTQDETEKITEPPETKTEISEIIQDETNNNDENNGNEEKFVVTPSGKRYHVEGCHHGRNVKEYLTREEAESRGYEPCKTCKP